MPDDAVLTVPQELLILGAAVSTGMIETLKDRPMTAAELAATLKADERAVWVVTEALTALGYLFKDGELLTLSEEARGMMFNPDAPNFSGFAFMHRYNLVKSWAHLPDIIRSGKPYPRERGPENTAYFMAAMRHAAKQGTRPVAEFLLAGAEKGVRVLDIGGGPLSYAGAFAAQGAHVTVLDLPEVVEMKKVEAEAAGIEMVPGDFNLGLPSGPFDLVYLGNVCHIFGERENRELFRKVAGVLVPGGCIAVADFIRGASPMAALFGVNMLVNTATGGTWTLDQYTEWLEAAGFQEVKLNEVGGRHLIMATVR